MGLFDFSLGDVGNVLTSAREAITGEKIKDPTELAKIDLQLQQIDAALKQGQISVNAKEAESPRLFVAGARPFIMWACGFALIYASMIEPVIRLVATLYGYTGTFPHIDTTITTQVLLGLLGLGVMRSHDKKHGTDTK